MCVHVYICIYIYICNLYLSTIFIIYLFIPFIYTYHIHKDSCISIFNVVILHVHMFNIGIDMVGRRKIKNRGAPLPVSPFYQSRKCCSLISAKHLSEGPFKIVNLVLVQGHTGTKHGFEQKSFGSISTEMHIPVKRSTCRNSEE